jgi:hypothetical protein
VLVEHCTVSEQNATLHASLIALVALLVASMLAGTVAACFAVPARRFLCYDYDIYQRYEVMTQRRRRFVHPGKAVAGWSYKGVIRSER